jgi:hypothetical protein
MLRAILQDGDNQPIHQPGASIDQIQMPVRDGIE